jgi:prefoldin beta subunit
MDLSPDTQEKITQLQLCEQNMHQFLTQKRTFQAQVLEIDNALREVETSTGIVYKIVGGVMLESTKDKIQHDLKERKDILDLRLQSVEKQEKATKEKAEKIQSEVMAAIESEMKKEGKDE